MPFYAPPIFNGVLQGTEQNFFGGWESEEAWHIEGIEHLRSLISRVEKGEIYINPDDPMGDESFMPGLMERYRNQLRAHEDALKALSK